MIDAHLSVSRSLYSLDFPIRRPLFSLVNGKDHLKKPPAFSIGRYRTLTPSIDCGRPSDRQPGPLYEPDRGGVDLYVRLRVRVSTCSVVARVIPSFWREYLRELAVMGSLTYREMRW